MWSNKTCDSPFTTSGIFSYPSRVRVQASLLFFARVWLCIVTREQSVWSFLCKSVVIVNQFVLFTEALITHFFQNKTEHTLEFKNRCIKIPSISDGKRDYSSVHLHLLQMLTVWIYPISQSFIDRSLQIIISSALAMMLVPTELYLLEHRTKSDIALEADHV